MSSAAVVILSWALTAALAVALGFALVALARARARLEAAAALAAAKDEAFAARLRDQSAAGKALLDETVRGLREQFANLAAQTLKAQSADLSQLNRSHLDAVLAPLRDQMAKLEETTLKAQNQSANLGASMGRDVDAIARIARDLAGVASALASDTRCQGRKGEEILAEKLRQAGLEEGVNFFLQRGTETDRPDAQVCDTENRWLIIDSKVSLTAYLDYAAATDDAARAAKLAQHVASVRQKIDQLAKKKYPKAFGEAHPERDYLPVTAMFVPYEAPLAAALGAEPSLWQFALENNVVLLTPLTLLGYMRLVYLAWQHEKEARNQQEIVATARELLARTNGFLKTFEDLGGAIAALGETYEKARAVVVGAPHAHTIANSANRLIALHVRLEGKKGKKVERAACLGDERPEESDHENQNKEKTLMKTILFAAALTLAGTSVAVAACPPQNPARVDEIAAWLDEKPGLNTPTIADRATWSRIARLRGSEKFLKHARAVLAEPVVATPDELYLDFTRNGNRTRFQDCNNALNANLTTLVFAELFENKGRYLDKIVAYLDAECAQPSWTLPAHDAKLTSFRGQPHIDLGAGMKACLLAQLVTMLGERLPAATREKVTGEIDRRIFKPYLIEARKGANARYRDGHWWFEAEMNWNSVCNDTCCRAALLLIADRRVRAEFVEAAERTARCALRGYGDDGYCLEGMGYWNYGYGHYIYLGLAVRAATKGKVDLFADPKTKKVMEYAYGYQMQTAKCPSFADGGGIPDASLLALGRQVWPDLVNTAALNAPLRSFYSWTDASDSFALRAFGQEPAPVAPTMDVLPRRTWFPCAQVLISRDEGKDRAPFSCAVKGGHNAELHNHNDVGSYAVAFDGFEYAGDPAGEIYTRRTFSSHRYDAKVLNSYGHPVPRVGERLQGAGRRFQARVVKTDFTDARDVIVFDITRAYAVSNLTSLVRTVTFDRAARALTVADEVAFAAPTAFESPIVTYADVVFDYDKSRLELRRSRNAKLDVTVDATGGDWAWSSEVMENPGRTSAKRLAVRFAKPVAKARVAITYTAPIR